MRSIRLWTQVAPRRAENSRRTRGNAYHQYRLSGSHCIPASRSRYSIPPSKSIGRLLSPSRLSASDSPHHSRDFPHHQSRLPPRTPPPLAILARLSYRKSGEWKYLLLAGMLTGLSLLTQVRREYPLLFSLSLPRISSIPRSQESLPFSNECFEIQHLVATSSIITRRAVPRHMGQARYDS